MRALALSLAVAVLFPSVVIAKPRVPTLVVETEEGHQALDLVAIRVETTIRGHLARTECELTYRNEFDEEVEGDFNFPLPPDSELTGLGLYFNGKLRRSVAVEAARARVAYDATVHQRIDPALAEWTSGRRAHLRVYPIPAHGEKKVWLSYDEELLDGEYVLDLRYGKRLRAVDIRIDADGRFVRDGMTTHHDAPFRLQLFDQVLDRRITTEGDGRSEVLSARDETTGRWYAASAPRPTTAMRRIDPASRVVVFWDRSGSAMHRDDAALTKFLEQFAARQRPGVKVTRYPFDLDVGDPLEELHNIGATNYIALFARMRQMMTTASADTRFVLVTDGLTSLGDRREIARAAEELGAAGVPLVIVNASPDADDLLLARLALATKGWAVDLGQRTPEEAVDAVMRAPGTSRVSVASESELKPLVSRELRHPREVSMVRSAFARAVLRQLLLSMAPDEQIVAHGRRFQQLTPLTSLIVLDSWRDYERWEIPMPDDVRAEKEAQEREWKREAEITKPPVIERPAQPPSEPFWILDGQVTTERSPLPGTTITLSFGLETRTEVSDENGLFRFRLTEPPQQFTVRAELSGFGSLTNIFTRAIQSGSRLRMDFGQPLVSEAITVTAVSLAPQTMRSGAGTINFITKSGDSADVGLPPTVRLRREGIETAIATIRGIQSIEERVRAYLEARSLFGGNKAFHLQAAMLLQSDAPRIAVRILTDLAELYPDDSALLRILARILEGWNEKELARLLLQHALDVASYERQTWRELILLEAGVGNGAAIERLGARVAEVDEFSREEVTGVVKPLVERWHARPVAHDLRLEENAALQVDLMWDTDYTDVDLYVTEPGGAVVSYQCLQSGQGGRLHADITDGHGPEIYTIEQPRSGDYEIAIDYFGIDDTDVSVETLAHLIVYDLSSERKEFILVLTKEKEHRVVTAVNVPR